MLKWMNEDLTKKGKKSISMEKLLAYIGLEISMSLVAKNFNVHRCSWMECQCHRNVCAWQMCMCGECWGGGGGGGGGVCQIWSMETS